MSEASSTPPFDSMNSPESRQNSVDQHASSTTSPSDQAAAQPSIQVKPTPQPATNGLNPRSCVTCRKRKVKCDKRHPCSNCNKAAIECIFPGPGRAPRRSRKPPDTELLARLRRLEGVVQTLGKGVEDEVVGGEPERSLSSLPSLVPELPNIQKNGNSNTNKNDNENNNDNSSNEQVTKPNCGRMMSMHEPGKAGSNTKGMINDFGKLVVDERRSRYVSNQFWTSLSEEVAELQDILDDPTDEEDDHPSPESAADLASTSSQGFIFGFSSTILSLRNFHPPSDHVPRYWELYKSNIDPVMKLLHIPHATEVLMAGVRDLDHIQKPLEALLFAMYFAVVTSMTADDCLAQFGVDRNTALRKYRFAAEQAFARANFINTQDIMVLQAILLFLTSVRRTDDTRYVWTMAGLLIRLATSVGLHRDGARFGLTPFNTEMRRRLWWQICILDVRTAEDQGCEPSISEQNFDTKFPLNINDDQIDPSTKETPQEQEGATEMTFDLIRYSVTTTVRRLSYTPPGPGPCRAAAAGATLEHKEHIIEQLHQYVENKFLRHLDTNVPLHWVAATVARLIMAKMWLVVHHPLKRVDGGLGLPEDTKDRLFSTSVEVIDFSRLLETETATRKWGWLFRTYVQWHALAFVLSQLCLRTEGPEVDKAWMVIDEVFESWGGMMSSTQRGMMWKPLRKLMTRARAARERALRQRTLFPLDGRLGPSITPFITQPGPMMNGSSAGDYFSADSSSMSPEEFNAMTTDANLPPNAGNLNMLAGMTNYVDPTDLSSFMSQTQSSSNVNGFPAMDGTLGGVGSLDAKMTGGNNGDARMINLNDSNPDLWQFANMNPGLGFSGIPPPAASLDELPNDAVMAATTGMSSWDDMVKEFQMESEGQDAMTWAGVEI